MKCDESKQVAILCSLDWLNHFIDFFREDFLSVLDRARSVHLENESRQGAAISMMPPNNASLDESGSQQQFLQIEEEQKEYPL